MTLSNEDRRELERNESWLRAALRDTQRVDVDVLKTRVRVAVEEARSAKRFSIEPETPAGLTRSVKRAIRAEIGELATRRTNTAAAGSGVARRSWYLGGALAAAACLAAAILLPFERGHGSEAVDTDALAVLEAFESPAEDEFAESVDEIRRAIHEVESSLTGVAAREVRDAASPIPTSGLDEVWAELLEENRPS